MSFVASLVQLQLIWLEPQGEAKCFILRFLFFDNSVAVRVASVLMHFTVRVCKHLNDKMCVRIYNS